MEPDTTEMPHASAWADLEDPSFWRAGAISTTLVMLVVLLFLSVDSMGAIVTGGTHVPDYSVINQHIGYAYDWSRHEDMPVIGGPDPLFGKKVTEAEAAKLLRRGKLVIQTRACMDCHTFFGNGAYYGPDLTKAWIDPAWRKIWMPMTGQPTRADAMVAFLMNPEKYPTWRREMPNMQLTREDAEAVVAYLKWTSAINTNGFPANFNQAQNEEK